MKLGSVAQSTDELIKYLSSSFQLMVDLIERRLEIGDCKEPTHLKDVRVAFLLIGEVLGKENPEIMDAIRDWKSRIGAHLEGGKTSEPKRSILNRVISVMETLYAQDVLTLQHIAGLASGKMKIYDVLDANELKPVRDTLCRVKDKHGEDDPELAADCQELIERIDRYLDY